VKPFVFIVLLAATAHAQDSSYSALRLRAALLRNPVAGHITDDWTPGTGFSGEAATNVGAAELSLGFLHLGYDPTTAKPPYKATMFSLTATRPVSAFSLISADVGARLTDYRMDFDDPTVGEGLKTEEEVMLSAVARGRFRVRRRWTVFGDVSYGVLMLGTKTQTVFVSGGAEYNARMPAWLRNFLN
jgi:hypothetical protein